MGVILHFKCLLLIRVLFIHLITYTLLWLIRPASPGSGYLHATCIPIWYKCSSLSSSQPFSLSSYLHLPNTPTLHFHMTLTWTTCMILLITSVSCFWGLIALFSFVFVWSFVFVAVFSSFVLHCIFLLNIITQLVGMIICIKSFFFLSYRVNTEATVSRQRAWQQYVGLHCLKRIPNQLNKHGVTVYVCVCPLRVWSWARGFQSITAAACWCHTPFSSASNGTGSSSG